MAIRQGTAALLITLLSACSGDVQPPVETQTLSEDSAVRFADLALSCIHREYPNKLGQVLEDDTGLQPPRVLHPAFYGCFDWHSSVHGHWMLVKLLKEFPDIARREQIVAGLARSLTADNIAGEVAYLENASKSWERTYGWAWLLQLATELHTWDSREAREWSAIVAPLAIVIRDRYIDFLPRQEYPVRTGVHPNTAFGLSFAFDYAVATGDEEFLALINSAARFYYENDRECPVHWEPSGEDFLSPCYEEAALMARVMSGPEFAKWLPKFIPAIGLDASLIPANVSDRSDPKIVHLDGLNLSRAWNLLAIADQMHTEKLRQHLRNKAHRHLSATLPHVSSEHYEGSHWLGSFAVYALTR